MRAPGDLSADAQALWPGLIEDLKAVGEGNVAEVDALLLADVLRARDRLEETRTAVNAEGLMVKGSRDQQRPHPLLTVERALAGEIAAGFDRLRLSPKRRGWAVKPDADGRLKR